MDGGGWITDSEILSTLHEASVFCNSFFQHMCDVASNGFCAQEMIDGRVKGTEIKGFNDKIERKLTCITHPSPSPIIIPENFLRYFGLPSIHVVFTD